MLAKWKTYEGQKVLYLDCRGLKEEGTLAILDEAAEMLRPTSGNMPVLANVQGTMLTTAFMEKLKKLAQEVYIGKTDKAGIVGVDGLKKILLNSYNILMKQEMRAFPKEEEALRWLVEKEK